MCILKFPTLLENMRANARLAADVELLAIFDANAVALAGTFEASLPDNNPWAVYDISTKQFIRNMFVDGFREINVTGSWDLNHQIHAMLCDEQSCFWAAVDAVFPPLESNPVTQESESVHVQ